MYALALARWHAIYHDRKSNGSGGSVLSFVGRRIVTRKAEIGAPLKPDPKKPGKGGRKKSRNFAYYIDQGLTPYEAYVKAGFPVLGVRGPSGQVWRVGLKIPHAMDRAQKLSESPRIQGWISVWSVPPADLLEQLKSDSVYVLHRALQSVDENGNPTSKAINAADSILDRTGLGRGTKVAIENRNKGRDPQQLAQLRQDVLEALRREGAIEVQATPVLEGSPNVHSVRRLPENTTLES